MDKRLVWALRILLTAACAFAVGFILYNSIQTAVESAAQSSRVVEVVQQVVANVAPDSPIVTATGEDYDKLHAVVRNLAHFAEYGLLGVLSGWCYRSYTDKKLWLRVAGGGVALLAVIDECLQIFSDGRGAQFTDVLVDVLGGSMGLVFAVFTVRCVQRIVQKRRAHETR